MRLSLPAAIRGSSRRKAGGILALRLRSSAFVGLPGAYLSVTSIGDSEHGVGIAERGDVRWGGFRVLVGLGKPNLGMTYAAAAWHNFDSTSCLVLG